MMLKPGLMLQGRYEILEQIGSGGMSEVYKVKCHKLNRIVAIKVLKEEFSEDANFVGRFKMEAQSAAGLSHPNIVSVYDVVDEGNLHYIVMEIIEGITLKSYILKKGHLGLKESIGIAIQVAQGMGAAHDQHIVHRDIKPQNIIISKDGKVKVADFGIARAVSSQTSSSTAVGSVHYISPEQAKGSYSDARSDIYSFGITLYEMVTGKVPFDGETTVAIAIDHIQKPIIPPSVLNPEISQNLEQIILKCTQKSPDRRYSNAYEVIADLRRVLIDPDGGSIGPIHQGMEDDASSPTVIIGGSDLEEIRDTERRNSPDVLVTRTDEEREIKIQEFRNRASGLQNSGKNGKGKKHSSDDVNPQIEKILTTVGIVAAFIIIVVVVTIFARVGGGILNSGSGKKEVEVSQDIQTTQATEAVKEESTTAEATTETHSGAVNLTELGLESMKGEAAKAALEQHDMIVNLQTENSDTIEKDFVTRYEPQEADPGGRINLFVSAGPVVALVKVPSITGTTPEQAKAALAAVSLTPGAETSEKSTAVPKGQIIRQSVIADSEVPAGTAVDYTVSTGKGTKFVAVVNDDYSLKNLFGPSSGDTQISVQIVAKQIVNGQEVTQSLLNPRMMGGDITIPVHFNVTGADGVLTGEVQILDLTYGRILKTYPLEFVEVSE